MYDIYIYRSEKSMKHWETPTHNMKLFTSVSYLCVIIKFYKVWNKSYSSACWLNPLMHCIQRSSAPILVLALTFSASLAMLHIIRSPLPKLKLRMITLSKELWNSQMKADVLVLS